MHRLRKLCLRSKRSALLTCIQHENMRVCSCLLHHRKLIVIFEWFWVFEIRPSLSWEVWLRSKVSNGVFSDFKLEDSDWSTNFFGEKFLVFWRFFGRFRSFFEVCFGGIWISVGDELCLGVIEKISCRFFLEITGLRLLRVFHDLL